MKETLFAAAVLSIAFWFSWPKIQALNRYGVESAARGGLGLLRIRIDETKKASGKPPEKLENVPPLWESAWHGWPHGETSAVVSATTAAARDSGGWGFDAASAHVFIDCTHTDSRSSVWTAY